MIAPSDWAAVVETVDAVKDCVREEKASIIQLTQLNIHTVLWNAAAVSDGEEFAISRKLEERKATELAQWVVLLVSSCLLRAGLRPSVGHVSEMRIASRSFLTSQRPLRALHPQPTSRPMPPPIPTPTPRSIPKMPLRATKDS